MGFTVLFGYLARLSFAQKSSMNVQNEEWLSKSISRPVIHPEPQDNYNKDY